MTGKRRGRKGKPPPPADLERLRELWDVHQLSSTVIGEMTGRTKNAVIGIAHRNGFAHRGSPIRPLGSGRHPGAKRTRAQIAEAAKARRAAFLEVKAEIEAIRAASRAEVTAKLAHNKAEIAAGHAVEAEPPPPPDRLVCQFIAGDGRPWTVCGERVCRYYKRGELVFSSYCRKHHLVCRVPTNGMSEQRVESTALTFG